MKRVAVIGLGNIATRHRQNLKYLYPDTYLYAMSSSGRKPEDNISNCDQLVESVNQLVADKVDMVIVASPAPYHAHHAIPLLQAGIPVLIEKPVASAAEDADAIIMAARKHKTAVAVGYCLRYLPSAKKIHALLSENTVGRLHNASIEVGQYLPDWRPGKDYHCSVSANANLGGGALLELSHELDYSQWLLGKHKVHSAILRSSNELKLDVEDSVDLLALTECGAVATIHLDFLQRVPYRRCRFTGNAGTLQWDLIENSINFSDNNGIHSLYSNPNWDKNIMYLEMIRDFERMIKGQSNNCISVQDAKKTLILISEIRQIALPKLVGNI